MRVGLLTEGGYPYPGGEGRGWCDRLARGLAPHDFEVFEVFGVFGVSGLSGFSGEFGDFGDSGVFALSGGAGQGAAGREGDAASGVRRSGRGARTRNSTRARARAVPLSDGPSTAPGACRPYGRRERRRFAEHFGELAAAVAAASGAGTFGAGAFGAEVFGAGGVACGEASESCEAPGNPGGSAWLADRFASGLYGLAELARDAGGLPRALRSEHAVRLLEAACHAPGASSGARGAHVGDLLTTTALLERALRPLSFDWYGAPAGADRGRDGGRGLAGVDLCHATTGGPAALPGLLAKRFFGTPLLVTEYEVRLRAHHLDHAYAPGGPSSALRSLLAAFHGLLAAEVYAAAALITCGDAHARRWQERCGADRARVRTVHPGLDARPYADVGEDGADDDGRTLLWTGRVAPSKDLVGLLHAFALIRAAEPDARLRIVGDPAPGREAAAYLGRCRALAAELFPEEGAVSFEEPGGGSGRPAHPADAYAPGSVVVSSSVTEGFPHALAEAMFGGRATVSTDVGAVREVIGGTGLVVPPRTPHALAEACVDLLRAPERRARLGAAARARALELFTAERNTATFHGIYLELVAHCPVRGASVDPDGQPLPFARPAESHVPGHWSASASPPGSPGRTARFRQWLPGSGTATRGRPATPDEPAARVPGWARHGGAEEPARVPDRGRGTEAVGAPARRPEEDA